MRHGEREGHRRRRKPFNPAGAIGTAICLCGSAIWFQWQPLTDVALAVSFLAMLSLFVP